jgi:hypothetical protein
VVVNAELGKQGSHTEIEKRWDGNNIVTKESVFLKIK